jgi:hypothetical protein
MYHGNWCGPGWSNGSKQESVRGYAPAIDEFDETCRQHDFAYADRDDLRSADMLFARENLGYGFKRSLAAVGVGLQGTFRPFDKHNPGVYQAEEEEKEMVNAPKRMLRGSMPGKKSPLGQKTPMGQKTPKGQTGDRSNGITTSAPPTSIGSTIRAVRPVMSRTLNEGRLVGRDFIGTVEGNGVSTFGLGKSALLSPAYFASTLLGNLARSFEQYRWNRLRVHYVPKVATTLTGQVVLCSQKSVSEPCLQPESGTFLNRAMSQGNAVFSPLWMPSSIDIDCDGTWRLVDPATTSDLDDNIHEELQVYTQVSTQQQCGYLFAEYDVAFREPIYQPHSSSIPISTGPGQRVTLVDTAAINAPAAAWQLSDSGGSALTALQAGTIYRAVFDLQGSTIATGATFGNLVYSAEIARATTTTHTIATSNQVLSGGTTFYLAIVGNNLCVYATLEQAIGADGSGQYFYRTATTVAGAYVFDVATVHFANAFMGITQ